MTAVRIGALIAAHHRPQQLERLLRRLSGDLWRPIVHVDAKSDIAAFAASRAAGRFVDRRIPVRWGGYSTVQATLVLIRHGLEDPALTHLYLMSGQCYPLRSDDEVRDRVGALPAGRANMITCRRMPTPDKPLVRLEGWHPNDLPDGPVRDLAAKVARRLPGRDATRLLRGLAPHGGGTWWLLERATLERMLAFLAENPWYERAFRFSLLADEMFFQTLLVHLGPEAGSDSPTATRWVEGRPHPEPVTREAYEELRRGEGLFARKFDAFYPDEP